MDEGVKSADKNMIAFSDFKSVELMSAFAGSAIALSIAFWSSAAVSLLYGHPRRMLEKLAVTALGVQLGLACALLALSLRSLSIREALGHGFGFVWVTEIFAFLGLIGIICSLLIRSGVGKRIAPATVLWLAGIAAVWVVPGK